ncbi:flagellar export protein FliJ [Pseudalkalibacillus sp. SCS-8]|uniref:flagellar export protein FliJ n=1 Tax=Pseudalkalibacillus nanhaiensis TaxID=3115291 RepID=UPI0032D9AE9E
MAFQYRMDQIIDYKNHEKDRTHKEFLEKQTHFEEIGYELFSLLKKKEVLLEEQAKRIQDGAQINTIQSLSRYIHRLEEQERGLQKRLQQARNQMDTTQDLLLEQTIDVKKYEKLRKRQFEKYQHEIKMDETKHTDELAVLRYSFNENR